MTLVRIIKDWDSPDLLRQTPGSSGIWEGITYTLDAVRECDYVFVFNQVPDNTTIFCPPENIWQIMQEPPVPHYAIFDRQHEQFGRIYTQDTKKQADKYYHSQPALPWHVGKSYDELHTISIPEKTKTLSWITSNANFMPGHEDRLTFLKAIRGQLDFDLWGRGFTYIDDKWDGLTPYHYALAIENYSGQYYWSEKLADCFLSWTMPIYYGCTHIEDYFPAEALLKIDIHKPDEAIALIQEAIATNLAERSQDAIHEARRRVLEEHQFFPYFSKIIHEDNTPPGQKKRIHLKKIPSPGQGSLIKRAGRKALRLLQGQR